MNESLESLLEALREELREYGALRNVLDEQQKCIIKRSAAEVTAKNLELNGQLRVCSQLREKRKALMRLLTQAHSLPENATLSALNAVLPQPVQPLFKAIADEINSMIKILRRRLRQNQVLLSRTCETIEDTLRVFQPDSFTKTYSAKGSVAVRFGPLGGHIQAVG